MPQRASGWRRRPSTKRAQNPRLRRFGQRGRTLPGAPRQQFAAPRSRKPWEPKNPRFTGPITEWIVMWYFTRVKGWTLGNEFFYQGPIPTTIFFSKGFTRGDFIIPFAGAHIRNYGHTAFRAVVLDPITWFTHPHPWFDQQRRADIAREGYQLIFLEARDLEKMVYTDPNNVIELGLRGRDISRLGRVVG